MAEEVFDTRQQEILAAMCRTLLPSSDTPGADELGVVEVIETKVRYMPVHADIYRNGIEGAERSASLMFGKKLVELDAAEAKQLMQSIETGQAPAEAWAATPAPLFFATLRMDVLFVYSSDPLIWERIKFPGSAVEHGGYDDIGRFPETT